MRRKWRVRARDKPLVAGVTRMKGLGGIISMMVVQVKVVEIGTRSTSACFLASVTQM